MTGWASTDRLAPCFPPLTNPRPLPTPTRIPLTSPGTRSNVVRRLARVASLGLVLLGGVTCTDGPSSPGAGGPALVRVAPQFSRAAAAALGTLGQFGLAIDTAHVRIDQLDRLSDTAGFDTVVAVPPGSDTLRLSFPIVLSAPTERLQVTVDLRHGQQLLFSGTQIISAAVGAPSTAAPPVIAIEYVGPGAGATQLFIAPRDTVIGVQGIVKYLFTALDSTKAVVTSATVAWSLSDSSVGAIDSGTGTFVSNGTEGETRVFAVTPNALRDSTTLTITAPPSKLVILSGGAQTGAPSSVLPQPLVVQAQTPGGHPVAGVAVTFVPAATGSVNPAAAVTDSTGRAQATMTLGRTSGIQIFGVLSSGLAGDSVAEYATAGPGASMLKVAGDSQTVAASTTVPVAPTVRIIGATGAPLAGIPVVFAVTAGGGSVTGGTVLTDSTGTATVGAWMLGGSGAQTLVATSGALSATFTAFIAP